MNALNIILKIVSNKPNMIFYFIVYMITNNTIFSLIFSFLFISCRTSIYFSIISILIFILIRILILILTPIFILILILILIFTLTRIPLLTSTYFKKKCFLILYDRDNGDHKGLQLPQLLGHIHRNQTYLRHLLAANHNIC